LSPYRTLKSIPEEEEIGDNPRIQGEFLGQSPNSSKLTTFCLGATVPLKINSLAGGGDTIPNISNLGVNSFILSIENSRRPAS